jgi:hypothetical protein
MGSPLVGPPAITSSSCTFAYRKVAAVNRIGFAFNPTTPPPRLLQRGIDWSFAHGVDA